MKYSKELIRQFYTTMIKIRFFEEQINDFFLAGEIPGFTHLYIGEEAIATGIMANLTNDDKIASTHRGHGHTIAKGADLKPMMAEIFGKRTGYCKGKGGSMHIADFAIGMLGANGVVGGGINLAVGAALSSQMRKTDEVAVAFFGDGASNRGTVHEGMNFASAFKLPVLFVCEMNEWASTTPYRTTTSVEYLAERAKAYSMPGVTVDGNDVFAVYDAAKELVERARRGEGPAMLECRTYRMKGHFVGDPEMYRTREEVEAQKARDPISRFEKRALAEKIMTDEEFQNIRAQVTQMIIDSVQFAKDSPFPDPSEAFTDLFAEVRNHA